MVRAPAAAFVLAASAAAGGPGAPDAPPGVQVTGDRLTGAVLPVEPLPGDIEFAALRAWRWSVADTQRLYLEGEAEVSVGGHRFRAPEAVIWINRLPSAGGLISQIAVFFERLEDSASEAGPGASGRVLVTGSARGAVTLESALVQAGPPEGARASIVAAGEERLADHLRAIIAEPPGLAGRPRVEAAAAPVGPPLPLPGDPVAAAPREAPPEATLLAPPSAALPPLFRPEGAFRFAFAGAQRIAGEQESVIALLGPVVVEYQDLSGEEGFEHLTLTADRAVVFTDPGPLEDLIEGRAVGSSALRGIYLEGAVSANANDGEYVLRAPRAYYDVRRGQALALRAVLRTYSREGRVPIYARAAEMRQIAADQWEARRARVSTSDFFTPHLALGAGRVTITRRPPSGGHDETVHIDSRDNTLRVAEVPVLYWPRFAGTIEDIPLKSVTVGAREQDGVVIRTRLDAFSVLGLQRPPGVEAIAKLEGYTDRGPAAGLDLGYELGESLGRLDLYGVHDEGTDRTSSGRDVTPDDPWRGVGLWEHRTRLDEHWTFQAQLSAISDETFITSWREEDFAERREYETSGYLRHLDHNAAFTVLGKYALEEFISNSSLLASRAYQVEKLPEATYRRYGDSLFEAVTYSGETRLSRVRIVPETGTPRDLGVPGAAFGIGDDDSIAAALGVPSDFVNRFDTRHELAVPMAWGPIKATPFLVGRFTAYDDDLEEGVSSDSNTTRVFGAAGLRLHTLLQRVDDTVESRLFDLHRLRHLVEPRLALWYGYADVADGSIPVYDQEVEAISTGTALEVALRNVFQTRRGGPARWRSVDVLTVDAGAVFHTHDITRQSPTPRFFEYRPEYSQMGDHVFVSGTWLPSDHLSFSGQGTWDLDQGSMARASIGTELLHTPRFSTYVEYRTIDADSTRLLDVGWRYWITRKYRVALWPQWDFEAGEFRSVTLDLVRRFPEFDLTLRFRRDEIADETSFGASLGVAEF